MTYCVSDIHGEYDKFKRILQKINFSDSDILYVLGDAVDRGPEPVKVLLEMMEHSNIIPLAGNHELMALPCFNFLTETITEETINNISNDILDMFAAWHCNGGKSTLDKFGELDNESRDMVIDYIMDFSAYEEVTVNGSEYILVHAGFENFSPKRPLDDYTLHELVWERPDYGKSYFPDKYVVSGHTPTSAIKSNSRPYYIYKANNHIAIDCGACFEHGRLGAICLETGEEFYSD